MSNPNPERDKRVRQIQEEAAMKGQFNDSPAYVVDKDGVREMRSVRDLHDSDCLYRTHNGKCDCALGPVINDAATRMRDRCVEKVRELSDVWKWADENSVDSERQDVNITRWDTANKIAAILESLPLDGEQDK